MKGYNRLYLFRREFAYLIVCFLFSGTLLFSQDSNYWLSQVGNTSALLGGAAVNGTFDNSGIYYNPGSLAFVENSGISLSGNAFYFNVYNIKNGAGDGLDLKTSGLTNAPSIVSGVLKNKKHPGFNITYAVMNLNNSNTLFSVKNIINYDVISSLPGDEYYIGIYKYQNKIREDWVGGGMAKRFLNSKIGIGISQFVAIRTLDFQNTQMAQVFASNVNDVKPISTHNYYEDFGYSNIGLIWKVGVNYDNDNFMFGLTITTPKASLPFINGRLIRNEYVDIPTQGELAYSLSYRDKTTTVHRTPWMFDFGASFVRENHSIYIRLLSTTRVKPYSLLKLGTGNEEYVNLPDDDNLPFKTMQTALRPVVNVAIGYIIKMTDNFSFLSGLRTDFNNYDEQRLSREENYVPSIGYLNLYHLSAGTVWYGKKYRLTVGFTYSTGYSKGDLQQINLTSPSDETSLYGIRDYSTTTHFNQIAFHFGFTYLFSLIQD